MVWWLLQDKELGLREEGGGCVVIELLLVLLLFSIVPLLMATIVKFSV